MMGTLGTIVGIWVDKWDQQQGITNFIVLPLTFYQEHSIQFQDFPIFGRQFLHLIHSFTILMASDMLLQVFLIAR